MKKRVRVLLYSHDSFGLGHIRRCRTIAHGLAESFPGLEALIVSGSPIIGSFDFKARVDFIRVPGIIKLRDGSYESLAQHRSIEATTQLRASLIEETALRYDPHLVIVDKEPLGLRGELSGTLEKLKARGARLVLGLRDVLDAPKALAEEWERKRVFGALEHLYDDILVFGLERIYDPLSGLALAPTIRAKVKFTGYLRRPVPPSAPTPAILEGFAPFLLVTAGGGGDGAPAIASVLNAYDAHGAALPHALIVLGPFMPAPEVTRFRAQAQGNPKLRVIQFDPKFERLMMAASHVAAMAGYNTFCEILSYDRKTLLMPRRVPRLEQAIRAERAQALGLAQVLPLADDQPADPHKTAEALIHLPLQAPPSAAAIDGLLSGNERVAELLRPYLTGA